MAFKATADPDTMHLHEALGQPDRAKFIEAMMEEIQGQEKNGNWEIIKRIKAPQGQIAPPAVWAMRRKRRIATREVCRWKARLNLDGSKQVKGVHHWESCAPVASWPVIRLVSATVLANNWHTKQIDCVMAHPQAKVPTDNAFMETPRGFEVKGASPKDCV